MPVSVVDNVISGVVVELATVPAKPFAVTTDTFVTDPPEPAGGTDNCKSSKRSEISSYFADKTAS